MRINQHDIALIYLARKAEGKEVFFNFLHSYNRFHAGTKHDLIIILKGYEKDESLRDIKKIFQPYSTHIFLVSDKGYDLDAYFTAMKLINHEYICCLNTFSEILCDDWLKYLYDNLRFHDTGLVGATGSYESNRDSLRFYQKVIWHHVQATRLSARLNTFEKYFDFIIRYMCPSDTSHIPTTDNFIINCEGDSYPNEVAFEAWWDKLVIQVKDYYFLNQFPSFPNPHIRTNAFMMQREDFIKAYNKLSTNKLHTSRTESGHNSITRFMIQREKKAKLITSEGTGIEIDQWPESNTFRQGFQKKLIVADNRTRNFDNCSHGWQVTQSWLTWGANAVNLPDDFPSLGEQFDTNRLPREDR